MSVVVAVKEKGVVYMAADTQTTGGDYMRHNLNEVGFKIKRLENGILLGLCGSVRSEQVLAYTEDVFTLDENGALTKEHLVNEVLPCLYNALGDRGLLKKNGRMDSSCLVAYKDALYQVRADFQVIKRTEYAAIGSGLDRALYALSERTDLPVRERLYQAVSMSAEKIASVSGPYLLIDTAKAEFEIVQGE